MAATRIQIHAIDGDGHVLENVARLIELLDEPYREFRSVPIDSSALVPLDGVDRNLGTRLFKGKARTTQDWLEALDLGPMSATVVYPTLGLFSGFVKDPDYQAALCRAYNSWLAEDICGPSGGRVLGVGLIPTHHEAEAERELRRSKELGMVGAMLPADGTHLWGHRRFDGMYAAAAELDFPVAIHASGSTNAPGAEIFPKFIQAHSVGHPYGILRHFTSMMFEGVSDRFPTVRFGFLETGATWVPWWLDRLDEEFENRGGRMRRCSKTRQARTSTRVATSSSDAKPTSAYYHKRWISSVTMWSCTLPTIPTGTATIPLHCTPCNRAQT
jgi:predicted TIM-barrel fold metal-dependent hydrolase